MNKTASESTCKMWQENALLNYLDSIQDPRESVDNLNLSYSSNDYKNSLAAKTRLHENDLVEGTYIPIPDQPCTTNENRPKSNRYNIISSDTISSVPDDTYTTNQYPLKSNRYPISAEGTVTLGPDASYTINEYPSKSTEYTISAEGTVTLGQDARYTVNGHPLKSNEYPVSAEGTSGPDASYTTNEYPLRTNGYPVSADGTVTLGKDARYTVNGHHSVSNKYPISSAGTIGPTPSTYPSNVWQSATLDTNNPVAGTSLPGSAERYTANEYLPKSNGFPISPSGTITPSTYPSNVWSGAILAQQPPQTVQIIKPIKNYMRYSIFVSICCFCPIGIFALMCSVSCERALSVGNVAEARAKSRIALVLANISLVLGIFGIIVIVVNVSLSQTVWKSNSSCIYVFIKYC